MVDSPLHPLLPTEVLRQIVFEYVSSAEWRDSETPRHSYKPAWSVVQSLTFASKVVRQLALEAWFQVYFVRCPDDLLNAWSELSIWTRELHCVELGTDLLALPLQWNLGSFHRLRRLRVDFDPSQSNAMLLIRFDHPRQIASHIQELEVYDVSWPSPMTARIIAESFLGLRVLKLSQDLVWCNLCNICCFATFSEPPPAEIVYEKVVGLPSHYIHFLKSLTMLQYVTLCIAYGLGGKTSLSESNDDIWTGECDACMDMMYASDDYRREWVEKKKNLERPPSLKSVTWRFRQKNATDVIFDVDDEPDGPPTDDESDTGPPLGQD